MIDVQQLRDTIKAVLDYLDLYSEDALALLVCTAAVESGGGSYLRQISGPARGIFQMEPGTFRDIDDNYLAYRPELRAKIEALKGAAVPGLHQLETNLAVAIAYARVHYLRVSNPLPAASDIEGVVRYWKDHYNTALGAGSVEEGVERYMRYLAKAG